MPIGTYLITIALTPPAVPFKIKRFSKQIHILRKWVVGMSGQESVYGEVVRRPYCIRVRRTLYIIYGVLRTMYGNRSTRYDVAYGVRRTVYKVLRIWYEHVQYTGLKIDQCTAYTVQCTTNMYV